MNDINNNKDLSLLDPIDEDFKHYKFHTETVEQLSLFPNYKFIDENTEYIPPKYDGRYKRKRKVLALINPAIYRQIYHKKTYRNDKSITIPINLYNNLITLNPYRNNPRVIIYFLYNYYILSKPIFLKELRDRIKTRVKEGPDFVFLLELRRLYYDVEQILKQTKYI